MPPNKFFIYTLGSFISFCVLHFMVVAYVLIPDQQIIPNSHKQLLLENTNSQKVIIDSGSNSLYAIDPNMLEDYFKLPVINLGAWNDDPIVIQAIKEKIDCIMNGYVS